MSGMNAYTGCGRPDDPLSAGGRPGRHLPLKRRAVQGMKGLGIEREAIRKKRPEDNGIIKSDHAHLKMNYLWTSHPRSYADTRDHLATSLRHFNEVRPHSMLNYLRSAQFSKKMKEEAGPELDPGPNPPPPPTLALCKPAVEASARCCEPPHLQSLARDGRGSPLRPLCHWHAASRYLLLDREHRMFLGSLTSFSKVPSGASTRSVT